MIKRTIEWEGRALTLETGRLANQANGSVLVSLGSTSVLCTVVCKKDPEEGVDFFPLSVHYQEKYFSAGKFPGGFVKREGKPSERETLVSRLIDRAIRPLFPDFFLNETQVICTVLNYDPEVDGDIPAMIGASCALAISDLPFLSPIAAVKVGMRDGAFIANPTHAISTDLELVVAGTKDGIVMVESQINELNSETVLNALEFGFNKFEPVINLIQEIASEINPKKRSVSISPHFEKSKVFIQKHNSEIKGAFAHAQKKDRYLALDTLCDTLFAAFQKDHLDIPLSLFRHAFKIVTSAAMREDILTNKKRIDARSMDAIRPISCDVGFFDRLHGSGLFSRGETQVLCATTLGGAQDMQTVDGIAGESKERFMLYYNFPPYSVGEVGRMGAPGRREIGHGKLAYRAIQAILPSQNDFPYAIQCVAEVLSCNGSSSMGTVCAATLSLMDAGVPIKRPVAGIAMGLIYDNEDTFEILSDIIGDEDHLGDMDLKVAGSAQGLTALQMDIKITNLSLKIMKLAIHQAHQGIAFILEEMKKVMGAPRKALSKHAPQIKTMFVPSAKIRDIIGSGGKNIRDICEKSGVKIDITEEGEKGKVVISGLPDQINKATAMIDALTLDAEVGKTYPGKVIKILEFGAIVKFLNHEGMVHISEISATHVHDINDVLSVNQEVSVRVLDVDKEKGRIRLSMKEGSSFGGAAPATRHSRDGGGRSDHHRESGSGGGGYRRDHQDGGAGGGGYNRGGGGYKSDRSGGGGGYKSDRGGGGSGGGRKRY